MQIPYPKTLALICLIFTFLSCSSNDSEQLVDSNQQDNQTVVDSEIPSTSFELEILGLINTYRASKGLNTLESLNIIKSQTEGHTDYMIGKDQISHDNFSQRSQFLINNANAISVAENVASGFTAADLLVDAWINSDGHRQNIEGDFTSFHLTASQSSDGKWFFTNIFVKK